MSELARIEDLMDAMQCALISADFNALRTTSAQLETALTALAPQQDRARLERLRRKADRNAACALAAGRGVRAALHRLTEIRQTASGLVTYDEKGKRRGAGGGEGLQRRF